MRWRPDGPVRTRSSRDDAALEAVANELLGQFATDEDETALARLVLLPFPLMVAFQHHVHALEDIAVVVIVEGEDTLGAQDLLALAGDEVLQPGHELGRVERLVGAQRQRLHVLVVVMLQAVAVVMMIVVMAVVMIVVMLVADFEEVRLDFEDAVEI